MEELQQETPTDDLSYWNSVLIAGAVFGFILFIGQLLEGYYVINAGSGGGWISSAICLIAAFGGLAAVWHYGRDKEIAISLGKGALIGFLTGVIAQLLSYGLVDFWELLNPSYAEAYKEVQIAAIENNPNLPEAWKQSSIDFLHDPGLVWTIFIVVGGSLFNGVLSMFTGMIGAKIFGKKG
jgi:hypothetical protein